MGKANRRKRRQREAQSKRGEVWAQQEVARRQARRTATRKPPTWVDRVPPWGWVGICVGGLVGVVLGHYLLWVWVIPRVGDVVGRVPVVSTVVGWLFAGGAFVATGVAVVNDKTARDTTRRRLRMTAYAWGGIAVLCLPIGWAEDVYLPTDYWAGVFAGAYGLLVSLVAFPVMVLLWWLLSLVVKPLRDKPAQSVGWAFIGYGVLLLVWGSTLLRQ
ncbi:hypothetical protein ACQPYE_32855 [Actinosynnema sp. CA-299493]